MAFFFQNNEVGHLPSPSYAPQDLHDMPQFLIRKSMSYSGLDRAEELQPDDDMSDDGYQIHGEKKRRLSPEQVRALEKSFELCNKLEPGRKLELSRALGLQPRQIAIWFQNRRARWKTKQLEKEYGVLKRQFESLKADNDELKSQNKKLQSQLLALKTTESTRNHVVLHSSIGPAAQRSDHTNEPLSNMFSGVEENYQGFWAWTGQQNFQ